ncbi:hypothetical protein ACF061_37090 [Streptomyces sp. NPDC015220]|uniref:hypothetical protein n=1 Tax=Streptomyces sp. NPDC015220 TaxID=3364947 RepID=UPI0036FA064C
MASRRAAARREHRVERFESFGGGEQQPGSPLAAAQHVGRPPSAERAGGWRNRTRAPNSIQPASAAGAPRPARYRVIQNHDSPDVDSVGPFGCSGLLPGGWQERRHSLPQVVGDEIKSHLDRLPTKISKYNTRGSTLWNDQ